MERGSIISSRLIKYIKKISLFLYKGVIYKKRKNADMSNRD